jgi:hypothetical protein
MQKAALTKLSVGVNSAINGQIRIGDVRRFRTGDEGHHCGDLLNVPIAVERCGGLLRYRPITRGGIQICIDRTRLHVVDRDARPPTSPENAWVVMRTISNDRSAIELGFGCSSEIILRQGFSG